MLGECRLLIDISDHTHCCGVLALFLLLHSTYLFYSYETAGPIKSAPVSSLHRFGLSQDSAAFFLMTSPRLIPSTWKLVMRLSGCVTCLFYCRKLAAEIALDRSLHPKGRARKTFYSTYNEVILKIAVSGCLSHGVYLGQHSYRVRQTSYKII